LFTGIVRAIGRVSSIRDSGGDVRLTVRSDALPWREFDVGESIAVNGVCLTAVALHEDGFDTDVSRETTSVTAFRNLETGSRVNLEPSLAIGERLGGHLVTGHVDCVGRIAARSNDGKSLRLDVELPAEFSRYVARKGSVCIDGVSLTINSVSGSRFSVNIIPHTADVTIIGGYKVGTEVNVEVDLLARYLERLLGAPDDAGISRDFLKAHGYVD